MDRYSARINLHGTTQRERALNRLKDTITNKVGGSLSCKDVLLNGEPTQLVVNTGTKPYYKEFESLPNQTVQMGDYVEWANRTWLVYEADADDEVYIDGKMYECNYKLYWQDSTGKIISRWAYIQNSSSYSNGESGNATITLAANQFMVWMPLDDDTVNLHNTRMMIDNVTDNQPTPYSLTRPDNVTMKFGNKGCTYYIFTAEQRNDEKDKLVTLEDGTQVWICNYISPTTPPQPTEPTNPDDENSNQIVLLCHLSFTGNAELRVGGNAKTITGTISDNNGNPVDDIGVFEVITIDELIPYIDYNVANNKLKIKIKDSEMAIGGKLRIKFSTKDLSLSTFVDFNIVNSY